jgi:hypothetical protein
MSTAVTPTISVRKLDAHHDPIYGNGLQDFYTDLYAVAQLIDTSLLLLQGEWWENLDAGLPLFQQIVGVAGVGNNPQIAGLLIQQVIMSVPYVTGIGNVAIGYDSKSRTFTYVCTTYTQFGTLQTQFVPGDSATIPVQTR